MNALTNLFKSTTLDINIRLPNLTSTKPIKFFIVSKHKFSATLLCKGLTYCSQCGELIYGLTGYQCKPCKLMCHRSCLQYVTDKCLAISKTRLNSAGNDEEIDQQQSNGKDLQIEHDFVEKYFKKPTYCGHCGTILAGVLQKQGLLCCNENCQFSVHRECSEFVPKFICGLNTKRLIGSEVNSTGRKLHSKFKNTNSSISIKDFAILKRIDGNEGCAKVYQVEFLKNSKIYALKVVRKTDVIDPTVAITEAEVLCKLTRACPFLAQGLCTFQSSERLFYALEYICGPNLQYLLKNIGRLDESIARVYTAEVVQGLIFLHKQGIVHRDIKLGNIILTSTGHVKLIDFGFSSNINKLNNRVMCGTEDYMSPEIIASETYGFESDWWALGIVLCEMLLGAWPFGPTDNIFKTIMETKPILRGMSRRTKHLAESLLEKNPKDRIGDANIQTHLFFAEIDWQSLGTGDLNFSNCYFQNANDGKRDHEINGELELSPIDSNRLAEINQEDFYKFSISPTSC